ncbi:MAG: hypothetical protein VR67_18775 [Peptococcaceae bacterium BRH_c8a]|nr:MAG: hypothetical protein VR67_18775 [Peptococcaceae bacterium BRH_c8a]
MKIKIICGFLGAGKTTCICNILQKKDAFNAVLVNEFGDIGIDAELIQRGENIDMVELPSGCICCTLANDFVQAVTEIRTKINPERLIIEPSGLAVPSGILEALEPVQEKLGLEIEAIIGIVDADRFLPNIHSGLFGDFYTDQLANSDIIMVNKVDLVPPATLNAVEQEIRKYNESAIIIHAVNCEANIPEVEKKQGEHFLHLHFDHTFDSFAVTNKDAAYVQSEVRALLDELKDGQYGNILRAKGIYSTGSVYENFDFVEGNVSFRQMKGGEENKFIFIGKDVKRSDLEKRLAEIQHK